MLVNNKSNKALFFGGGWVGIGRGGPGTLRFA